MKIRTNTRRATGTGQPNGKDASPEGRKGGKWQGRVAPDPAKGDGEKRSRADG